MLKNIARIDGAGPLIVIDTEVVRIAQVEAVVERLDVVERGDRDAGVADLAVDVRPLVRIEAVEGDGVEGGRQPLRVGVLGQELEARVGAERIAFAREHPRRVLALALEGEDAGGVGEAAGHVLAQQPRQDLAVVPPARQRHLGDARAGERGLRERRADLLVAHAHDVLVAGIGLADRRPHLEQLAAARVELRRCASPAASSTAAESAAPASRSSRRASRRLWQSRAACTCSATVPW